VRKEVVMKVLVTAASRHGATEDVAASIARVLRLRGLKAEEVPPTEVHDLTPYDAVVVGSAVYEGQWLTPATEFVDRFGASLASRPVWLFSSGPVGAPPTLVVNPNVATIMATTGAREHRVFAGRIDQQDLTTSERATVRAVHAPDGDYRDWAAITEWATEIADNLAAASAESRTG
jgi:menaquinone-dependent protoporphyrinogen oxidase